MVIALIEVQFGLKSYAGFRNRMSAQSSDCKVQRRQHGQYLTQRKHLPEATATHGCRKEPVMLFSLSEDNSSHVEDLTCWICQDEFRSKECLILHYDDHMR